LFIYVKKTEMGRTGSTFEGEERYLQGLLGKPEARRPLARPTRRWGIILKRIFERLAGWAWTRFIWLRIRTGGELL
jgi:hypothetical protein